MIDCPNGEVRDQLPDYMHGQLSAVARATVGAHVATCAACSAELALLGELYGSMQDAPAIDVGKVVAALPSASRARVVSTPARQARRTWLDWRIAASIAVLAAGVGAAGILGGGREAQDMPERVAGQLRTAQQVAPTATAIDSYLSEASTVELQALLDDLESFDGLPAGEPDLSVPVADYAEDGL
jgi:anti-sigma factor RsiW